MFDKTQGRKALTDQVDAKSDEFADRFDGLDPRVQLKVLDKLNELLDNPDQIDALQAGTYAQNNAGQPAQALGSGSGATNDTDTALQTIMASSNVPQGVKAAIIRIITPSDPAFIDVKHDGTPKELETARNERDALKAEKEKAEKELKDERDENKSGSLAFQLKAAKAAQVTPADMVAKADALRLVSAIEDAEHQLSTAMLSSHIDGRGDLQQSITTAKQALS